MASVTTGIGVLVVMIITTPNVQYVCAAAGTPRKIIGTFIFDPGTKRPPNLSWNISIPGPYPRFREVTGDVARENTHATEAYANILLQESPHHAMRYARSLHSSTRSVLYTLRRTSIRGSTRSSTLVPEDWRPCERRQHNRSGQVRPPSSCSGLGSQPRRNYTTNFVNVFRTPHAAMRSPMANATAGCSNRGFFTFFSGNSATQIELGGRTPVEPGEVSRPRTVPDRIPKTPYYATGVVPQPDGNIHVHTPETLAPMREACILARDMLDLCCEMAQPGITTDEIDSAVHAAIVEAGACPSPLNYHGFPKSVCSSVNEVACHAIPDSRPLQDGDIVSFDVSVFHKGFHGDNCATVGVGAVDDAAHRLMNATKEGMMAGVSVCRPGACMTEIGYAIHAVADRYGYDTVRKYCGHGVGSSFHMLPFVEHFRNSRKLEMVTGMTFTIEPIFTEGSEATSTWSDGWTVQTVDGGRAAQFEHVVLITEDGHEILTVPSQTP